MKSGRSQAARSSPSTNRTCSEDASPSRHDLQCRVEQRGLDHGTIAEEPRARHRRERNRADELRIVAPAVAAIGIGPAPVEHVLAVGVRLLVERHRADEVLARPCGEVARRPAGARCWRTRWRAAPPGTGAISADRRRRARPSDRRRALRAGRRPGSGPADLAAAGCRGPSGPIVASAPGWAQGIGAWPRVDTGAPIHAMPMRRRDPEGPEAAC